MGVFLLEKQMTYNLKSITDILEYANMLQHLPLQEP